MMWMPPALLKQGHRTLEESRALFDPKSDHPRTLDEVKQISFYTDCLGRGHWSVPVDCISLPSQQLLNLFVLQMGSYLEYDK